MGTPNQTGRFALAAIVAIGLGLGAWIRFSGLEIRQLWLDENCTFYWARFFFGAADGQADPWREPAHVPYFLLLSLWTHLCGDSAAALRGFSALAGCAAVACLALVARLLAGPRAVVIAVWLGALHPLHVYYSQEARVYTFWTLMVALATYFLVVAAQTGRVRAWIGYGLLAWIGVLTHYYTLAWLLGTAAASFLADHRRRFWKHWLWTHLLVLLALLPPGWAWIGPYLGTGPADWQRAMWESYPPLLAIPKSLWALLPSGGYPAQYMAPLAAAAESTATSLGTRVAPILRWGPAVFAGLLAGAAFAQWLHPRAVAVDKAERTRSLERGAPCPAPPEGAAPLCFLAAVTLCFLLVMWMGSWIAGRGYLVARYDLAAWPSMTIAMALLVDRIGFRARDHHVRASVIAATTLFFVMCGAATVFGWRSQPIQNDIPERARRIAAVVHDGELVISLGMYRWFMEHEWRHIGFAPQVRAFPGWHDAQLCWRDAEAEAAEPAGIEQNARELVDQIEQELTAHRPAWLLFHGRPYGAAWEVDRRLFDELRRRRIEVQPVDEWVGLGRLIDVDASR